MRIFQMDMIYLELIFSARDNITLQSGVTYKIYTSSKISHCLQAFKNISLNSLNCIQPLHHNEIKYQGEAIPILCAMGAHGLQPEVEFSNFLALQISNAVDARQQLRDCHRQWKCCRAWHDHVLV